MMLPDMKERIAAFGFDAVGNTPEEFGEQISFELGKWADVIRAANIKAE
jgi:tripartite-type tricarboxylate transporter receptor subunit TctC